MDLQQIGPHAATTRGCRGSADKSCFEGSRAPSEYTCPGVCRVRKVIHRQASTQFSWSTMDLNDEEGDSKADERRFPTRAWFIPLEDPLNRPQGYVVEFPRPRPVLDPMWSDDRNHPQFRRCEATIRQRVQPTAPHAPPRTHPTRRSRSPLLRSTRRPPNGRLTEPRAHQRVHETRDGSNSTDSFGVRESPDGLNAGNSRRAAIRDRV